MSKKRKVTKEVEEDEDMDLEEEQPKKKKKTSVVSDVDTKNFFRFYNTLPSAPPDLIRIFNKKNSYSVYGDNANFVAEEIFKTLKVVKQGKDPKAPAGLDLKLHQIQDICRMVVFEKKWRVEIYSSDGGKWELTKKGSPGYITEIEDLLFAEETMQDQQVMLAVQIGRIQNQRVVGVAFVDVSLRHIGTLQFQDNDQLTNLESLFYQIGTKECLCLPVQEKDKDSKKLHEILEKLDIKISERKKTEFKAVDIEQDLKRLLGQKYWNSIGELDEKLAMGAANCLINALGLLSHEEYHSSFILKRYNFNQYMRLDNAAIQALNILPNPREPNQRQNLYGHLNKCRTPMGSRLLMQWLKQPLKDLDKIKERLDIVEIFVDNQAATKDIRTDCFKRIPDLERIAKKIQAGRAGLQDCVVIYQFIQQIGDFVSALRNCSNDPLITNRFTKRFQNIETEFKPFENLVEETVDLAGVENGEYMVNASFDEVLKELHEKKDQVFKMISQHEDDVRTLLGKPSSLKREKDKTHGYHFKITAKDRSSIESKKYKDKVIIIQNTNKTIKFTDAKMEKYTESYKEYMEQYTEQSRSLVKEILSIAASYMPVFEEAHEIVAELDVFTTLAYVSFSANIPYVKPTLSPLGEGNLELIACRHPVLESLSDFTYIPNDAILTRGESSFQIITGPNMGGKSTYIRSIGLSVLLAQMGCFVPCQSAHIPIRDAILARVGASDSQLRGVSTFMAEMLETATILSTATETSLIIIDELGRGTSTYDGFGLAWAISEFICNKLGSFCLFATHFHELTQLQEEIECVKNFHVVAEPDTKGKGLTLLYEVKPGHSDQSFGIHVAQLAAFPEDVIEVAKAKARELEHFDTNKRLSVEAEPAEGDQQEGKEIIKKVLEAFSEEPIDKFSDKELQKYIETLKTELLQIENPYISKLMQEVIKVK